MSVSNLFKEKMNKTYYDKINQVNTKKADLTIKKKVEKIEKDLEVTKAAIKSLKKIDE